MECTKHIKDYYNGKKVTLFGSGNYIDKKEHVSTEIYGEDIHPVPTFK